MNFNGSHLTPGQVFMGKASNFALRTATDAETSSKRKEKSPTAPVRALGPLPANKLQKQESNNKLQKQKSEKHRQKGVVLKGAKRERVKQRYVQFRPLLGINLSRFF
jgi:hypothetical protein